MRSKPSSCDRARDQLVRKCSSWLTVCDESNEEVGCDPSEDAKSQRTFSYLPAFGSPHLFSLSAALPLRCLTLTVLVIQKAFLLPLHPLCWRSICVLQNLLFSPPVMRVVNDDFHYSREILHCSLYSLILSMRYRVL